MNPFKFSPWDAGFSLDLKRDCLGDFISSVSRFIVGPEISHCPLGKEWHKCYVKERHSQTIIWSSSPQKRMLFRKTMQTLPIYSSLSTLIATSRNSRWMLIDAKAEWRREASYTQHPTSSCARTMSRHTLLQSYSWLSVIFTRWIEIASMDSMNELTYPDNWLHEHWELHVLGWTHSCGALRQKP